MTISRFRRTIVPPAAAVAAAIALIAGTALAQPAGQQGSGTMPGHDRMQSHAMPQDRMPQDPASRAYMDGMRKMNRDMRKPMTGDADRDFARMMLSHHQGAVDMAKVELQYGKDPDLKVMAQKIIDDQTREIGQLQDWLKQHPAKPAPK